MDCDILKVFNAIQENAACHQKYLKVLENIYTKSDFDEFFGRYSEYLKRVLLKDISAVRHPYVEKVLDFSAKFVATLAKPPDNCTQDSVDDDSPSHPFLIKIIRWILQFHDLNYVQARYYSCKFITLILKHIGYHTHLENDLCDEIQNAMLERVQDPKAAVRLEAVLALVRLQEPLNPECPIVKAYMSLFYDVNAMVRKEVVLRIGPNATTIPKIKELVCDTDPKVRAAAFARCADIGGKHFKIVDRQQILFCGFAESNKKAKQVFTEQLLPRWLGCYNGDFLAFISALKLDADENDIISTEEVCRKLMEEFFRTMPIKDIIGFLPIEGDKLVPIDKISSEVIMYWSILTKYLNQIEDGEEYLENICPELTPFCQYIESIITMKTSKTLEEWEYLDHQYILYNLFDMVEMYDLSDEVGRKALQRLILSILQNHKLEFRLLTKIMSIAEKVSTSIEMFTNEVCQIISDIHEPLIEKELPITENRQKEFEKAKIRVQLNVLDESLEEAISNHNFQKCADLQAKITDCKKQLKELEKPSEVEKVRVSRDDPETICWCLDLLTAMLQLKTVKTMSPALETCWKEFLIPLLSSNYAEVNWRALRCLNLYCLIDGQIAVENSKVLCIPIATYRVIPNYNKMALITSVTAVSDLIRVYGSTIISGEDEESASTSTNTTRRRLYRDEDMDEVNLMDQNKVTFDVIIDIILEMLDDENDEIRDIALKAIAKLIMDDFPVNPLLISRLLLKWFNPLSERTGDKIQLKLGYIIDMYAKNKKGARDIIAKAVIPIMNSISSAPRGSPLADIDTENVGRFLAAITNYDSDNDIVHIHKVLAHDIICKITSKPSDPIVCPLTKVLQHLEISSDDKIALKELIAESEVLVQKDESLDKISRRSLTKFAEKLKATQALNSNNNLELIPEENSETERDTDVNSNDKIIDESDVEINRRFEQDENQNAQPTEISNEKTSNEAQQGKTQDEPHCIKSTVDELTDAATLKTKRTTQKTAVTRSQSESSKGTTTSVTTEGNVTSDSEPSSPKRLRREIANDIPLKTRNNGKIIIQEVRIYKKTETLSIGSNTKDKQVPEKVGKTSNKTESSPVTSTECEENIDKTKKSHRLNGKKEDQEIVQNSTVSNGNKKLEDPKKDKRADIKTFADKTPPQNRKSNRLRSKERTLPSRKLREVKERKRLRHSLHSFDSDSSKTSTRSSRSRDSKRHSESTSVSDNNNVSLRKNGELTIKINTPVENNNQKGTKTTSNLKTDSTESLEGQLSKKRLSDGLQKRLAKNKNIAGTAKRTRSGPEDKNNAEKNTENSLKLRSHALQKKVSQTRTKVIKEKRKVNSNKDEESDSSSEQSSTESTPQRGSDKENDLIKSIQKGMTPKVVLRESIKNIRTRRSRNLDNNSDSSTDSTPVHTRSSLSNKKESSVVKKTLKKVVPSSKQIISGVPTIVNKRITRNISNNSVGSLSESNISQPVAESTRRNISTRSNQTVKTTTKKLSKISEVNQKEPGSIQTKRKKTRKLSKGTPVKSDKHNTTDSSEDTVLHTIVMDDSFEMGKLSDSSFRTPTKSNRRTIVEESSESESSVRRSARKMRRKNMEDYIY